MFMSQRNFEFTMSFVSKLGKEMFFQMVPRINLMAMEYESSNMYMVSFKFAAWN